MHVESVRRTLSYLRTVAKGTGDELVRALTHMRVFAPVGSRVFCSVCFCGSGGYSVARASGRYACSAGPHLHTFPHRQKRRSSRDGGITFVGRASCTSQSTRFARPRQSRLALSRLVMCGVRAEVSAYAAKVKAANQKNSQRGLG